MSVSTRDRRFWVVLVATLLSCSLTASLGLWQLRRADLKESLAASMVASAALPPVVNADLVPLATTEPVLHRMAEVSGRWVAAGTVYLDNRQMSKRQGFYVVTPLQLSGDGRVLWVQRGFVPRDFLQRDKVPEVATPASEVVVKGRMAAVPSQVYELGGASQGPIRQNLDVVAAAQELGMAVLVGSLVQLEPNSAEKSDGLARKWPVVDAGVHKHHGYAFQWFGLCALMVVLYVWFQILAPRRRQGQPQPPDHG